VNRIVSSHRDTLMYGNYHQTVIMVVPNHGDLETVKLTAITAMVRHLIIITVLYPSCREWGHWKQYH
jgi:hypothetical protein